MRIEKPLWHEGLILTQQHFQQQDRWNGFALQQLASAIAVSPWGTLNVDVDEEALASGRLKLTRLQLRFPDGTPVDTTVADALPPARDLVREIPADTQTVEVLAALALPDANGSNCRFDETALARPRRAYREFVKVTDLNGTTETEIAAERHAVRLLYGYESHADDTACAIARLTRTTSGQFQIDRGYVPPCLSLSGHPLHIERIRRLADILAAKSALLGARRRRPALLAPALHSSSVAATALPRVASGAAHGSPVPGTRPVGRIADHVFDARVADRHSALRPCRCT